jgi:hypothetical protein
MSPRILRAAVVVVVLVAGLAIAIPSHGATRAVGAGIAGLGAVLAVSLAFLEIGLSEDRDRAAGRD